MDPWTCGDPGRQLLKGFIVNPEQNTISKK
jgi:hypothetical protein